MHLTFDPSILFSHPVFMFVGAGVFLYLVAMTVTMAVIAKE